MVNDASNARKRMLTSNNGSNIILYGAQDNMLRKDGPSRVCLGIRTVMPDDTYKKTKWNLDDLVNLYCPYFFHI